MIGAALYKDAINLYVDSTSQRCKKKIIFLWRFFLFATGWCSLCCDYLHEFSKKFETILMGYSGAGGKLIHEKNLKSKISWHCPFKMWVEQPCTRTRWPDSGVLDDGCRPRIPLQAVLTDPVGLRNAWLTSSVGDPDPQDPHVVGLSGSISQRYRTDPGPDPSLFS